MTVLLTANCLFAEKSLVRDLSIGLRTSNHLRRSPEMLRQPPVAARVRVSATIVFLLLVTAPLTALGQSTGDFIPVTDAMLQNPAGATC